jgi:hypothetical protein
MALFFTYALPLVLPAAIYMLWRLLSARHAPSGGASQTGSAALVPHDDLWRDAPWLWLALAGAALLAVVLLIGVFIHGAPQSGRYVPPRMEGGQIVPGELHDNESGAPSEGR